MGKIIKIWKAIRNNPYLNLFGAWVLGIIIVTFLLSFELVSYLLLGGDSGWELFGPIFFLVILIEGGAPIFGFMFGCLALIKIYPASYFLINRRKIIQELKEKANSEGQYEQLYQVEERDKSLEFFTCLGFSLLCIYALTVGAYLKPINHCKDWDRKGHHLIADYDILTRHGQESFIIFPEYSHKVVRGKYENFAFKSKEDCLGVYYEIKYPLEPF